jgi:pimeloyl-ACP methyl ester carboxylesterase
MDMPAIQFDPANTAPTKHIRVDGVDVAYRRLGPTQGLPLLLLQRFRGTLDHWDPVFLNGLAMMRPVILFDSLGVGRTAGATPTDVAGMADFAAAFLDALDVPQVDALGWSMGGAVAQALAIRHPTRVRRLVVAGSGPGGVPDAPQAPAKVWEVAGKAVNDDDDFLYLFFPDTPSAQAAGKRHLARLGRRVEPFGPQVNALSATAQLQALGKWAKGLDSAYARLPELTHPTLVANGAHDIMVHAYNAYVMSQRMPNAELALYPDAGHGFLFQHAERFARRVHEFLLAMPVA